MEKLSARQIVDIWEAAEAQHPIDRALTVLSLVFPHATRSQLAHLSLGERDALLAAVRRHTFGDRLEARLTCTACREVLEFSIDASLLLPSKDDSSEGLQSLEFEEGGYRVAFRLPTSMDLVHAAHTRDVESGRRRLAECCVLRLSTGERQCDVRELPDELVAVLSTRIEAADPRLRTGIQSRCPACGDESETRLDVAEFLFSELRAEARRLLREVHALASAYGWSERDILSIGPRRRETYLQLSS
jgi:hypothetical protein